MRFKPTGICPREINLEINDDIISSVEFIGGCSGNTQGLAKLVQGMQVDDAIRKMEGIRCGQRPTSCPDQLAKALKQCKKEQR